MTIDPNTGRVDWAVWRPGPASKVYAERNSMAGWACHSMEGWLRGSLAELDRADRSASWVFSNCIDGTLLQHYPIWASAFASGNKLANTSLISVESEGLAGTPLNDDQVANMLRLMRDWEALTGHQATRDPAGPRTIWEHNEVALWATPNAGPTACPSNRYDPFFAALEETDMADPRVDEILKALTGAIDGDAQLARLASWNANGNSLLDGYGIEQQDQAQIKQAVETIIEHVAAHPGGGTDVVIEHTHVPGGVA